MATAIAEAILGPRPGGAIVSFWQGGVEIGLRAAAALLGALPAMIAAAVALVTATNDDISDAIDEIGSGNGTDDLKDLRGDTYRISGYVIGIAGLALIIEILIIVVRFCNFGLINLKITFFLIIDVIISIIFAVGLAPGCMAMAVFASYWDDYSNDDIDAKQIRNSMAASAAFCFLGLILFIALAVWMVIFAAMKWNYEVVKYTIKDAIIPWS